ncbi:MAG: class I SAM-dependent methyltransferase [Brevundimonas sp.]|uniref:class I SAM-dependent methyltransferase n=1 Tax=Brevundimonas sp. TaxID=1871086 RepID=UPI0040342F92
MPGSTDKTGDDRPAGWHWTDYWAAGRQDVMTVDGAGQGAGADTLHLWADWLSALPDGASILDLATGSGQIPRHALTVAGTTGKAFHVFGVDYADLKPDPRLEAAGVVLTGGVRLERLPFPDGRFDAVTSQYGIEYADQGEALDEAGRVLAPGGVACMLIHHADSEITRQAVLRLNAYDAVMGDGEALQLGRRAFAIRMTDPEGPEAEASGRAFRQAILDLARRTRPTPPFATVRYLVTYLNDLAMGVDRFSPPSALERLDGFERGNAAWRERQACQVGSALTRDGVNGFIARARQAGLSSTSLTEAHDDRGGLIGWLAKFERAGSAA